MKFFKEKIIVDKVLWKEIVLGILDAIFWCSVIFIVVCGYSDEIIEMIQYMGENTDKFWPLYFATLPVFIIIAIVIRMLYFVLHTEEKSTTKPKSRTRNKKK